MTEASPLEKAGGEASLVSRYFSGGWMAEGESHARAWEESRLGRTDTEQARCEEQWGIRAAGTQQFRRSHGEAGFQP